LELAERNSTKTGYMLGSKCDLKMHIRNVGYTLPYNRGPKNQLFLRRFHNLAATLAAYIFRTKYYTHNRASALKTTRALHCLKRLELWSTNTLKLDLHFYQPYVNFAFYFIARLRRRRLANGTLPNFAKTLDLPPEKNLGKK